MMVREGKCVKKSRKVVKVGMSVKFFAWTPKKATLGLIIFFPLLCILYGMLILILYPLYLYACLSKYFSSREVYYEEVKKK